MNESYGELTKEQVYCCIIRWLYENDGIYESKKEWRKNFLCFLERVLNIDNNTFVVTSNSLYKKEDDNPYLGQIPK